MQIAKASRNVIIIPAAAKNTVVSSGSIWCLNSGKSIGTDIQLLNKYVILCKTHLAPTTISVALKSKSKKTGGRSMRMPFPRYSIARIETATEFRSQIKNNDPVFTVNEKALISVPNEQYTAIRMSRQFPNRVIVGFTLGCCKNLSLN